MGRTLRAFPENAQPGFQRAKEEQAIRSDKALAEEEQAKKLTAFRARVRKEVRHEGRFRFPPKGFTVEGATKLFEMSGDIAWLDAQKAAEKKKKVEEAL
jgi:hypothetical protein